VLGQLAAQRDEYRRQQREEKAARRREEQRRIEDSTAFVRELEEAAQVLTSARLIADGFHQRRGEWRRLREST
jgi:hypothetical protein